MWFGSMVLQLDVCGCSSSMLPGACSQLGAVCIFFVTSSWLSRVFRIFPLDAAICSTWRERARPHTTTPSPRATPAHETPQPHNLINTKSRHREHFAFRHVVVVGVLVCGRRVYLISGDVNPDLQQQPCCHNCYCCVPPTPRGKTPQHTTRNPVSQKGGRPFYFVCHPVYSGVRVT